MNTNNDTAASARLPAYARLPINRCNLPPQILGSLTYQRHPTALAIDGVATLHKQLFELLDALPDSQQRAQRFMDYMVVQFRLHHLEDAGLTGNEGRGKADYLRLLRGWLFNPDGREAAVLKGWVESRFGLMPRYHAGLLDDPAGPTYQHYLADYRDGLYGTNALEAQLDLLYSYAQYELGLGYEPQQTLTLYRGINHPDSLEILQETTRQHAVVLLNNLNAFSLSRERADEFGDVVMEARVPWQKILFYSHLLPSRFVGEDEYLVIGGAYEVMLHYW